MLLFVTNVAGGTARGHGYRALTGLDHGIGHPWLPLDDATAPQARSLYGLHREAEGPHMAETRREAHALSPPFSPVER